MAPAADAGIFWAVALSRVSLLAIFVAVARAAWLEPAARWAGATCRA